MTTTWTNWSGSITASPQQLATPASEAELKPKVVETFDSPRRWAILGTCDLPDRR